MMQESGHYYAEECIYGTTNIPHTVLDSYRKSVELVRANPNCIQITVQHGNFSSQTAVSRQYDLSC